MTFYCYINIKQCRHQKLDNIFLAVCFIVKKQYYIQSIHALQCYRPNDLGIAVMTLHINK